MIKIIPFLLFSLSLFSQKELSWDEMNRLTESYGLHLSDSPCEGCYYPLTWGDTLYAKDSVVYSQRISTLCYLSNSKSYNPPQFQGKTKSDPGWTCACPEPENEGYITFWKFCWHYSGVVLDLWNGVSHVYLPYPGWVAPCPAKLPELQPLKRDTTFLYTGKILRQ